jgi:hypothetical protein
MKEDVYVARGYRDRALYLDSLATKYGVDKEAVMTFADILGPAEDFDALLTSLQEVSVLCPKIPDG